MTTEARNTSGNSLFTQILQGFQRQFRRGGSEIPEGVNVNFQFYYGNEDITDTIYQENDQTLADEIYLEVLNQSKEQITLAAGTGEVSDGNYHFALKFPQGVLLDLAQSEVEETNDWDVGYDPDTDDNSEVIYLRKKTEQILQASETVTLTLLQLCASPGYDSEIANIDLLYGPLIQDSSGSFLEGTTAVSKTIEIINPNGKSNIPLHVGFATSNTILNDGETQNSLTLQITNTNSPNSIKPNLGLNSESKLIVSFEMGEAENKPYALAEVEKVKAIDITVTNSKWQVQHQPNSTEWTISPQGGEQELEAGDYIKLELTNIVTDHPTGNANLYLRYQGIPDYRDGQFDVPIEKTPLLFRDKKVGIGTNTPQKELHVEGQLFFSSGNSQVLAAYDQSYGIGIQASTLYFRTGQHFAWYKNGVPSANIGELNPGEGGTVQMAIKDYGDGTELHVNGRIKDKTGYVVPVGTIVAYAGSSAPEGWLLCNGDSVSSSTYNDLYEVIGTTYGGSSSSFNLPDLQGRVPVGYDEKDSDFSLGKFEGEKKHKLEVNEMPSHTHEIYDQGHSHQVMYGDRQFAPKNDYTRDVLDYDQGSSSASVKSSSDPTRITILKSGSSEEHNNLQPYLVINYIIKY